LFLTYSVFIHYDVSQDHAVSILRTGKGKPIPVQVRTGPEFSRRLRLPGRRVSRTHRPPLLPRKYPRYSFSSEADSTQGT